MFRILHASEFEILGISQKGFAAIQDQIASEIKFTGLFYVK